VTTRFPMAPLDWLLVAAFVAYAVGTGFRWRSRASESLTSYFLADRSLSGWTAGLSMAATQFAADTPLVFTGIVATSGVFHLGQFWSYGVAFLLLGMLLAPAWRRAGVLTDAELVAERYPGGGAFPLRMVRAVVFGTAFNAVVLAMVLFATAQLAERLVDPSALLPAWAFDPVVDAVRAVGAPLTTSPLEGEALWRTSAGNLWVILAIAAVTLTYSTTGGLRSVVRTDLVQLAVMGVGTAIYAVVAWRAADVSTHLASLPAELLSLDPFAARGVGPGLVAAFGVQWLIQRDADGSGYLAQRVMACRSDRDAERALVVFAFVQVLLRSLLWVAVALALLVLHPPGPGDSVAGREGAYLDGFLALPPGVLGLLVTGMLAALASTVDTHLNWGASYWANDLYGEAICRRLWRREPGPRELVVVARASNALLLLLSIAVMANLGSIQEAWRLSLVMGAGVGPVLLLRWCWWRVTAWGELAALIASLGAAAVAVQVSTDDASQLLSVAAFSTVVAVLVSLATPVGDRAALRRFAERTRAPGFWAPVLPGPRRSHVARLRLRKGLLRTALASVTLFAFLGAGLLALLGQAALPSGPPAAVALVACVLVGVAALPGWWTRGRRRAADE
jgi:SSS family solute:Na+ symporter